MVLTQPLSPQVCSSVVIEVAVASAGSLTRDELVSLYAAVGWTAYTQDPDRLLRAVSASHRVVTARQDGRLVGLARTLSDGETIAYLQDILVDPQVQRAGVGRRLAQVLFDAYGRVRQHVLLTDAHPGQRAFYEDLGFTEVHEHTPQLRAFVRLG